MLSKRLSTMLLTGAAAVGLAATAQASITYDVEAFGIRRGGINLPTFAETKVVNGAQVGDIVRLRVYGTVTGINPELPQTLQSASGSLVSSIGGLKGNYSTTVLTSASPTPPPHVAYPWTGESSSVGLAVDLDGDGDLDLGSNSTVEGVAADFIAYRASRIEGPNSNTEIVVGGNPFNNPDFIPSPVTIGASTRYILSKEVDFVITDASGSTSLNWRIRPVSTAANWFEDATEHVTSSSDGSFNLYKYDGGVSDRIQLVNAPVVITAIPEPTTLGLMSIAGLGLLARRRK